MGWILLVLLLIAAAFGVLGLVVKATIFIVLTVVMSTILLAYIAYAMVKRQARKMADGAGSPAPAAVAAARPRTTATEPGD